MRAKAKVLLVVEGASSEPRLMRRVFESYGMAFDYEIYSYGTNVHDLFDRMFASDDDVADLELLGVLSVRETDAEKLTVLSQDYTDILLIFDYDPHDNRFNPNRMELMASYFTESTDMGRLFINYPMLESYRHLRSLPDADFLDRKISRDTLKAYKRITAEESCIQDFTGYTRESFDWIIVHNYVKAQRLLGLSAENDEKEVLNLHEVLMLQNDECGKCGEIYELCTCLLFVSEYDARLIDWSLAGSFYE